MEREISGGNGGRERDMLMAKHEPICLTLDVRSDGNYDQVSTVRCKVLHAIMVKLLLCRATIITLLLLLSCKSQRRSFKILPEDRKSRSSEYRKRDPCPFFVAV